MRPVPILYVIDDLGSGGAQRQMVELILRLDRSRYEPHVFYYAAPDFYAPTLREAQVPVTRLYKHRGFDLRVTLALVRAARQTGAALIHAYLAGPNLYAALAARLAPGLSAITSERSNRPERPLWMSALEAIGYRASSAVIANTHSGAKRIIADYRLSPDKVSAIHNGVDWERFAAAADQRDATRAEFDLRLDQRLLLLIGRPSPEKNHRLLIDALASIRQRLVRPWTLLVVGGEPAGDYGDELTRAISNAGLADRIRFLSPRRDIERLLAACDALVLPSLYEGCPNVVLEAQAAGRVVVASDVSDMRLLVADGDSGWLFDPHDQAQLEAILLNMDRLATDALLDMGHRGATRMRTEFGMTEMVACTTAVYDRLLARPTD
jgi:glycosyltransferase involved in cell wall biosynthesis